MWYLIYFLTGELQACFSAAGNHDWTFVTKQPPPQQCFKHSNTFSCNLLQQPKADFQGPVRAELEQTVTLITHLIYSGRSCSQNESIERTTTKQSLISSCAANRRNTRKQWLKQSLRSLWIKEKLVFWHSFESSPTIKISTFTVKRRWISRAAHELQNLFAFFPASLVNMSTLKTFPESSVVCIDLHKLFSNPRVCLKPRITFRPLLRSLIEKDTHSDLNWIIRMKCAPKSRRRRRRSEQTCVCVCRTACKRHR